MLESTMDDPTDQSPPDQRPAGRVLRVKVGYNPNSSSIGSAIPLFLAAAVGSGAVTVFLLNLLDSTGDILRRKRDDVDRDGDDD